MKAIKKQKGMSLVGFFLMLTVVGFVSAAAIKIGPIYMEYFTISSLFKELQGDRTLAGRGKVAIRDRLRKGFTINQIDTKMVRKAKITTTKDGYLVELKYEVPFDMVGNLRGIASFHPKANVNHP